MPETRMVKGFSAFRLPFGEEDFESRLFDHLSTAPLTMVLYQPDWKKSRFLFGQLKNTGHFLANRAVVLPAVGLQALGAVLDAVFRVCKAATTFVAQSVQGAVAEQAAEGFRISAWMTGEIFALLVLEKIVVRHIVSSFLHFRPRIFLGRLVGKFHFFAGLGMGKAQPVRPQGNLAGVIQFAVFSLAHQG